jgi:hypothetical protein
MCVGSEKVVIEDDARELFKGHLLQVTPDVLNFLAMMDVTSSENPPALQVRGMCGVAAGE